MTLKPIKVKLNTSPNLEDSLKKLSGAYRKIFNLCKDALFYRVVYNSPKNHFMSGTELTKVVKLKDLPFLKKMDKGIVSAAANTASLDFKFHFDYSLKSIRYLSRKKTNMKFKTNGNVRVHSDYIEIPKLGKIELCEKGRIPTNISPTKLSFTNDGNNWYITALVEDEYKREELTEAKVFIDFAKNGNLIYNDIEIESVANSKRYKRVENKLKRIQKKIKRQTKANSVVKFGVDIPVTTKNIKKSKRTLDKIKNKMYNVRKDSFNKIVKEVAITKPKELHLLESTLIKQFRNGYLTRAHRRKGSKELLSMLEKKLRLMGTSVIKHNSIRSFQEALGYRD